MPLGTFTACSEIFQIKKNGTLVGAVVDNGETAANKRLELQWEPLCESRATNNGHTIEVGSAGYTVFEEVRWRVKFFKFHTPSETQIDGRVI